MSFRAVLFDWRGTLATTPTASEWLAVYEHGRQKPDPLLFAVTLDTLGVAPADALMAGDRAGPDGGAVDAGLTTLLLPPLRGPADRRLFRVLALCGITPPGGRSGSSGCA